MAVSARILALAAAGILLAGPLAAQETGGVKVQGNTNIHVNAQNVDTIAVGSDNVAKTNIGVVTSGKGGTVAVDARNVQNIVGGHGRKGCINIGVKGADPACQ